MTTLRERFDEADTRRREVLERARLCAAMVNPSILPPEGHDKQTALPEAFQSVGSMAAMTLKGKMLLELVPIDRPFFVLVPEESVRQAMQAEGRVVELEAIEAGLLAQTMILHDLLESTTVKPGARFRTGFRAAMGMAIDQVIITGDTLKRLNDDYSLTVFRRDAYVTSRADDASVLFHATREMIDPAGMSDDEFALTGLPSEVRSKPVGERMQKLYTFVEWQPRAQTWTITQEVNDREINQTDEKVSPYMGTPFDLAPGEDYGRGLVEKNLGDLRSLNRLEEHRLEILALAGKQLPVVDPRSGLTIEDLTKKSGEALYGRVGDDGTVAGVGILSFAQVQEYQMLVQGITDKSNRIGRVFLSDIESQPRGERVTAFQSQLFSGENYAALGGGLTNIADHLHIPLVQRLIHIAKRDPRNRVLNEDGLTLRFRTGLESIKGELNAAKMFRAIGELSKLGPEAFADISIPRVVSKIMQMIGVDFDDIAKTDQEKQAERQAAIAAQTQALAAEKAVDVVGNVAEQRLTQENGQ